MQSIILIFHVLICFALVALVLLQHGKGADIGAAFGSGASQTVFGSQGASSFLFKLTATLAALFFTTSLTLSFMAGHIEKKVDSSALPIPTTQVIPATPMNTNSAIPADKH